MKQKVAIIGEGFFGKKIINTIEKEVLFTKPELSDWVVIATPNDLHYEHVKKWIEMGKNVFCEKPLTLTHDSSNELYNLAQVHGVRLYVDDVFHWFVEKEIFSSKNITFKWFKYGSFNANIIDNLAYHHFYLWINTKFSEIKNIHFLSSGKNKLTFRINLEN